MNLAERLRQREYRECARHYNGYPTYDYDKPPGLSVELWSFFKCYLLVLTIASAVGWWLCR